MCGAISRHAQSGVTYISDCLSSVSDEMQSTYRGAKRQFRILQRETLPRVASNISELATTGVKQLFFALPYLALALGHYKDAFWCSVVTGASALDIMLDNNEYRKVVPYLVVPVGINLALRSVTLLANRDSFTAVSIGFQLLCLMKISLIASGQNI
jgi:hypothetical protein